MIYVLNTLFSIIGPVDKPPGVNQYGNILEGSRGINVFLGNIIKLIIVVAGIYALFNFVLAGYSFMSAGGDPKKVADAWAKIWQTILGLLLAAGAFVIARIVGQILFDDPLFFLRIQIFGP